MGAAIASTTPLRSNLRSGSNHLVLSLFFFSSVLLMQMPKGNAALDPEEESELESFRQRFNQLNETGDLCDSSWVICSTDSEVAHVEEIHLWGRGLKGTIPADFATLRHIKLLDLQGNKFTGPLPDLSNMTNLTYLDLSRNQFTGKIFDTSAFTKLSLLRLSSNRITGDIPPSLFQHPSMREIYLGWNSLVGPIPDMSYMKNLEYIHLSSTYINGSIPESISKLVNTTAIMVYNNPNLRGSIPNLSEMVGLTFLDLSFCGLSGVLPGLESSTKLRLVDLQSNDFSGSIPHALFEHPTLEWLYLSNNPKLSGEIPDMSKMSKMIDFQAFNCNFEGPLPNMKASTKLVKIDVSNNKLHGNLPELPAGSAQSDQYYRLLDLNFTNNNFSGEIPMSWTELIFLRTMRLDNNGLSGYIPGGFGGLTNLQELNLSSNNFSGPIPNEFGLLKNLRSIDLRNNLFDNIPEALASLPNLTTIRLENNKYTAIPEALIQKYKDGLVYLTWDHNTTMTIENSTAKFYLSTGAIVGIAIGGVVLGVIVICLCMCETNRRRQKKQLPREEVWNTPSNSIAVD